MPDNKITATINTWGAIDTLTIETPDPEFIITTIQKLKPAMPNHGPQTKKTQT